VRTTKSQQQEVVAEGWHSGGELLKDKIVIVIVVVAIRTCTLIFDIIM
jgi:hypothetical protein